MLSRVTRSMVRCFSQVQAAQGTSVVEPKAGSDVPVYLKPYDKTRYEVPMEKIKLNSGYAFLEIEPFPRAKIMKACYHIMEQLSIGFPESCIFRIYNEERTKYIMKVVDQTQDVEELEDYFGVETIELFIDNLTIQLEVINVMRHSKIWEVEADDSLDLEYMDEIAIPKDQKNPAYKKADRPRAAFVEE